MMLVNYAASPNDSMSLVGRLSSLISQGVDFILYLCGRCSGFEPGPTTKSAVWITTNERPHRFTNGALTSTYQTNTSLHISTSNKPPHLYYQCTTTSLYLWTPTSLYQWTPTYHLSKCQVNISINEPPHLSTNELKHISPIKVSSHYFYKWATTSLYQITKTHIY